MTKGVYGAIDVGWKTMSSGFLDSEGNIDNIRRYSTPGTKGGLLGGIEKCFASMAEEREIVGLGLSVAGRVTENGEVYSPELGFKENYTMAEHLKEKLGVPLTINNDAVCFSKSACIMDPKLDGCTDAVFLKMGTCLEGVRMENGALEYDSNIAHMKIGGEEHGCRCGKTDCAEVYVSGWAAEYHYYKRTKTHITFSVIGKKRDDTSLGVVRKMKLDFWRYINMLGREYRPQAIAVGGELARIGELFENQNFEVPVVRVKLSYPSLRGAGLILASRMSDFID